MKILNELFNTRLDYEFRGSFFHFFFSIVVYTKYQNGSLLLLLLLLLFFRFVSFLTPAGSSHRLPWIFLSFSLFLFLPTLAFLALERTTKQLRVNFLTRKGWKKFICVVRTKCRVLITFGNKIWNRFVVFNINKSYFLKSF